MSDWRIFRGEGALFKLTEDSLENLKKEKVPKKILEALEPLKNQEIIKENKFLEAIEEQIGGEIADEYKILILKHADNSRIEDLPAPPGWRHFRTETEGIEEDPHIDRRFGDMARGQTFYAGDKEIDLVNTALYLRRPLLVTGKPGAGKSTLAYAVAHELRLGKVLRWPITSHSTIKEGLYTYDAVGRLQELQEKHLQEPDPDKKSLNIDIGKYIRLGPLGTALLPSKRPRVLLIDEIDKSDIDLPNNLLNIFEEGEFDIPELARLEKTPTVEVLPYGSRERIPIIEGKVRCTAFPFVVLTSNSERELPPAFMRRCLSLDIKEPTKEKMEKIIQNHFANLSEDEKKEIDDLITTFLERRQEGATLATDQLLNAIYLTVQGVELNPAWEDKKTPLGVVLRPLNTLDTV